MTAGRDAARPATDSTTAQEHAAAIRMHHICNHNRTRKTHGAIHSTRARSAGHQQEVVRDRRPRLGRTIVL
jgi:hypothetical protein